MGDCPSWHLSGEATIWVTSGPWGNRLQPCENRSHKGIDLWPESSRSYMLRGIIVFYTVFCVRGHITCFCFWQRLCSCVNGDRSGNLATVGLECRLFICWTLTQLYYIPATLSSGGLGFYYLQATFKDRPNITCSFHCPFFRKSRMDAHTPRKHYLYLLRLPRLGWRILNCLPYNLDLAVTVYGLGFFLPSNWSAR